MASTPQMKLWDRLSGALGDHDVHPADRAIIQQGYLEAGGPDAAWADLPADIQQKVIEAEGLPRQSWDDPADVPDNVGEL